VPKTGGFLVTAQTRPWRLKNHQKSRPEINYGIPGTPHLF
jgi:hypothetical protein